MADPSLGANYLGSEQPPAICPSQESDGRQANAAESLVALTPCV